MKEYDFGTIEDVEQARLIKTLVTPRPIGWISTQSADGIDNLAPFSCFSYVNTVPPVVLFRAGSSDGTLKDSPRNAIETGEFVVNIVTQRTVERMDETAASLPSEQSEFEYADIERSESVRVSAPRVADAVANLECTLHDSMDVYDSTLVLGDVEYVHLDERATTDGTVDAEKVDTVGRLGGPYYTGIEPMDVERRW